MKYVVAILFLCSIPFSGWAQKYTTAAGLRLGTDWGISLQQRLMRHTTLELILQNSLQREEVIVTGLLEKHFPILGRRLNFYAGAGLHRGWIGGSEELGLQNPWGLSLVGGLEFTLGRINISYDYKPAVNIEGGEQGFYNQSGISLRYVLLKDRKMKKRKRRKGKKRKRRFFGS